MKKTEETNNFFKMSSILKFLLVLFLCHREANAEKKSCTKFPEAPEPTALASLRKKLKCNYDINAAPLNGSNARLKMQVYMDGHRFEYYGNNEHFTSSSYFLLVWHDDRLKWNEAEYKNHSTVYMRIYDIWSPTVVDPGIGYFYHPSFVLVMSSGQVNYLLWWQMTGHCKPTYAKWTDKRLCSISFQLEPAEKLLLRDHFMLSGLNTAGQGGSSWTVVDVTRNKNERISRGNLTDPIPFTSKIDTTLGLITIEMHLQRNTAIMDATLFSPAAVLFLLVLASTWIPCNSSIRLALLALTILLEIFLMHFATRSIPTLPGRFSDFALLYRDLVMVSGAAFFEWYIAYLVASKNMSSGCLQSVAGRASQSSYAFTRRILLIPSNPTKVVNGSSEGAFLSVILDRVAFVVLLVVFIILTVLTAHRPTPTFE